MGVRVRVLVFYKEISIRNDYAFARVKLRSHAKSSSSILSASETLDFFGGFFENAYDLSRKRESKQKNVADHCHLITSSPCAFMHV